MTAEMYAPGRERDEHERLGLQGGHCAPDTRDVLVGAGIGPGDRVLDVGCGVGDLSLLAAELVGPAGSVLGVDVDGDALAIARARTDGLGTVSFEQADYRRFVPPAEVDAVVGRMTLMYAGEPAPILSHLARAVRPGGVLAFQELDLGSWPVTWSPPAPLTERCCRAVREVHRRSGASLSAGRDLRAAMLAAGLVAPEVRGTLPPVAGADPVPVRLLAEMLRSFAPAAAELGVTDVAELDVSTLEQRLLDELAELGGVGWMPPMVGCWARVPADR